MADRKVVLTMNVSAYLAGMELARAKRSRVIRRLQRVVPLPVWVTGWVRSSGRQMRHVHRLAWLFRDRVRWSRG